MKETKDQVKGDESIAREDDVVNNSSSSRGSENLLEFEATDNNDESKSSISCGCLLFLSHVRGKYIYFHLKL